MSVFRFEFHGLVSMSPRASTTLTLTSLEAKIIVDGLAPSLNPPLFTCPDGRTGLHVIHTRFLLGQQKANTTFIASRLMLLSTFFTPSLNAQTTPTFLVVASYDSRLPSSAVEGLRSELNKLKVPVLLHGETFQTLGRSNNEVILSHANLVPHLLSAGLLPPDHPPLDVYITSRMDADDAVHVDSIASVQKIACASPVHKNFALQVAYMRAGLLWEPSSHPQSPHGSVARPDPEPKYLAILQSMLVSGAAMARCPLDVYSHQHMQPYLLVNMTSPDCPFVFRCARNIHIIEPPREEWGSLYVRTTTSSTATKNKTGEEAWKPASVELLKTSFGLEASSVLLTNMMFSGLEEEAGEVLMSKNSWKW